MKGQSKQHQSNKRLCLQHALLGGDAFKVHYYVDMEMDISYVGRITLKYSVHKLATKNNSQHLCPLVSACLNRDHITLKFIKYEISFAGWLRKDRDTRQYMKIFSQIIVGLRKLHNMWNAHKDLRTESEILSTRTIKITLVNFEHVTPRTQVTRGTDIGQEGYMPYKCHLKDGETLWDIYMHLLLQYQSQILPRRIPSYPQEKRPPFKAEQHIKEEQKCPKLRDQLNLTMLRANIVRMESLNAVEALLVQIQFRSYTKDAMRRAYKPALKFSKQRGTGNFGAAEK